MLETLSEIAKKIIESNLAFILQQLYCVFFYKNNLKKLEDQVEDLEGQRDRIRHLVNAEKRNGKAIFPDVLKWLEEVEKIIGEAEQLQGNADHASVGCCPNLLLQHQFGCKAEAEAKTVGDCKIKGEKFISVAYDPPSEPDFSAYTRGIEVFESRMTIMEEIMHAVTSPNISLVGVYGLGGVGKTTLVYQVAAKAKLEKSFDAVVRVSVTLTPDFRSIQGQIADQLGLKFEEESLLGRASRLRERIKKEKTIFILLDNIRQRFDMNEVGIPLGDYKGCKVLLTSRTQEVLNEMESQKDFRLDPLDESETWKLFQVMVGGVVKDRRLQYIAPQVANKCAGLPVLITAVSRALKGKGIHAWKYASKRLTRVDNNDLSEIYRSALELSYNGLEANDVKELFLLCGILGTSASINNLLKYGTGLGIFKDVNTMEDTRNRIQTMIDSLKASCLLLEGDSRTDVKMHDNVREVAVSIAFREEHFFMKQNVAELMEWPAERYTQIILEGCHILKLPTRLENPELKLLYLNNINANGHSFEMPDSFFEGVTNLKLLDFTQMNISSLPISLSSLTKLKTLILDGCALGGIASLGAMKNVEILSLCTSSITQLPTEIGQLTRLRMLDLTSSGIELIPPNIISSLIDLEEFYVGDTPIKWEAENATEHCNNACIAELNQLPHLTALNIQIQDASILPKDDSFFEQLERYKIVIGDVWTWFDMYRDSNILKLKLINSTHIGQGMRKLLEGVEELHLDEIKGISNVIYQLNFEGFLQLKYLRIQNSNDIRHIVDSTECIQHVDVFPNLEALDLYKLSKLEKIWHGPLTGTSFQKLKVIKVKNCDHLESLISSSVVRGLSQLVEIEVSECHFMKEIVVAENFITSGNEITTLIEFHHLRSLTLQGLPTLTEFYSDKDSSIESKPLFSYKVALYNLEILKLGSINLKKIWDDSQFLTNCCVQNLTSLIVEGCGSIKYLFLSSMIRSFSNLKLLEISNCHEMEEIVAAKEERNNGVNLAKVQFPKLEKMIINGMKNLKTVWHRQFGSLRTMEMKNCEKLVRIFPSHMQTKYSNLETIMVTDCSSLEHMFELNANEIEKESEVNTQLRILILYDLPNLKQIWNGDTQGIICFNNLEAVRVRNCPELEYLFPLSIAISLPQLEEISIKGAWYMQEFVAKIEGCMEGTVKFEFNRLIMFIISNLLEVDRFYAGNFTLQCPSLKILNVFDCPKLELFKMQSTSYQEREHDGHLDVSSRQPIFFAEEVITKLEEMNLTGKDVLMIQQGQFYLNSKLTLLRLQDFEDENAIFPYWILQKLPNLRSLWIEYCSFNKILHEGKKEQVEIATQLKEFVLNEVHNIQHLCKEGSQLDPVLEVVETIDIERCSGLIYLVPSYVTFSHLTYLSVVKCNGFLYLISSSTARGLVQLRQLDIKECESLEEIVKEKEDEMEQIIAFNNFRFLKLKCLPGLNWFSSSKCLLWFPILIEVVVEQCPRMKTFSVGDTSTPNLRNVQVEEGWLWEGNLNTTIQKMSTNDEQEEG